MEKALLEGTQASVSARGPDNDYFIRMEGRAVAGISVMAHERRLELLPWISEERDARIMLAIPFWPETLEYVRSMGNADEERFSGKTEAGVKAGAFPRGQRWRQLAFGGVLPILFISLSIIWLTLAIQGAEMPFRFVALGVGCLASISLIGGVRLWYRATAFMRWREGRCHIRDAGLLGQGWLAPRVVFRGSSQMLLVGLVFLLATICWGRFLMGVTFASTGLWVLWPVWVVHLSQAKPEPDED